MNYPRELMRFPKRLERSRRRNGETTVRKREQPADNTVCGIFSEWRWLPAVWHGSLPHGRWEERCKVGRRCKILVKVKIQVIQAFLPVLKTGPQNELKHS